MDEFLLQVHRPGQYIGGEWNVTKKDFKKAQVRFALGFPDLYEIGMSNLGLRIIYGILNNIADVVCERFFAPEPDLENVLRGNKMDLCSIESRRSLKDFDLAGFSLGTELCYTNVLNILDLGGIPLKSAKRDNRFPLIIGGGPAVLNPEPMHDFFDFFVIGEAEEAILEIIEVYRSHKDGFKSGAISKQDLLLEFVRLGGIYVPGFYEVSYDAQGGVSEFRPKIKGVPEIIRKRFVGDFNNAYFPAEWLVPYVQIVHDRITLEVMRGCPNRCRFCQARSQYYPLRVRDKEKVMLLAQESYRHSGYEEISLGGLSVSDYPHIEELCGALVTCFKDRAVSISLPSLKPRGSVGSLSSLLADIKKIGLTFAPEAGSARLRRVLAKDFDEEQFFKALEQAYLSGYQRVKLYFMIGLPSEEKSDLDALSIFSLHVSELRKKIRNNPAFVNISINTLIPKPHTPFQWLAMEQPESMREKEQYLREKVKRYRRLELNFHNRSMSLLEGIFSRGDRRLSEAILLAFQKGARFDAWGNYFSFSIWEKVFAQLKLNPYFYLESKSCGSILPWGFIDCGLDNQYLEEEYKKLVAGKEDIV